MRSLRRCIGISSPSANQVEPIGLVLGLKAFTRARGASLVGSSTTAIQCPDSSALARQSPEKLPQERP
jgi:hypothetical protein